MVEVVESHGPGRGVRDAVVEQERGDVTELMPGRLGHLDPVVTGGCGPDLGEVGLLLPRGGAGGRHAEQRSCHDHECERDVASPPPRSPRDRSNTMVH